MWECIQRGKTKWTAFSPSEIFFLLFDTLGQHKERTGRGTFSFIDCEVQFTAQLMQVLHENELEAQRITNLQDLFICTLA